MTTEEIHNTLTWTMKMSKSLKFAYLSSVINSNGDCSQEKKRRLRLKRVEVEELGKIHQEQRCVVRDQS